MLKFKSGFIIAVGSITPTFTPSGPTHTPGPTNTLIPLPENSYPVVDTGQTACYDDPTQIDCPGTGTIK